jgi:glucose-6-phosphate 1-epimerase
MGEALKIDALNGQFGIGGIAEVVAGSGGLSKLVVKTRAAAAEIYLHGAQVTAWKPTGAEEILFLSEHSIWQASRAIRGGIPICFPWFRAKADDASAPAHGFVRTKEWQLEAVSAEDEVVALRLVTESDDSTRRWWNHEFRLVHRITIGPTLQMELTAENTGTTEWSFEEALHTYFKVGDVQQVRVRGLDGVRYLDNRDGNREKVQGGDVVIAEATDRAYIGTRNALELVDSTLRRVIRTDKDHSETTVVWNPWEQGAAALTDFGNEEWRRMTCVEACNILGAAVRLGPGQSHTMTARLSVMPF